MKELQPSQLKKVTTISASDLKNGFVISHSAFFNWILLIEPSYELQVEEIILFV